MLGIGTHTSTSTILETDYNALDPHWKKKGSVSPIEDLFQSISSKESLPLRFKYSFSSHAIQFSEICLSGIEKYRDTITSAVYYDYLGIFMAEWKGNNRKC